MFKQAEQLEIENRNLRKKEAFNKFLQDVGLFLCAREPPICFISYAWEDNATEEGKKTNIIWLTRLKHDLERVGAIVFLDIYDMHGDMPTRMQENITKSHIIFLIGTTRLKKRLEQVPRSDGILADTNEAKIWYKLAALQSVDSKVSAAAQKKL